MRAFAEGYRWPLVAAAILLALDVFIVERLVAWDGLDSPPSYLEYQVAHGFDDHLALLGAAAVIYLAVLSAALLLLHRRLGRSVVVASLLALAVTLHVAVVAIATFGGTAFWYRHVPHGSSAERGAGFDAFADRTRLAFFALCVALLFVAALCGWGFGRSLAGRRGAVALLTTAAFVGYFALVLPYVDYENSCYAGRAFVFHSNCG